MRARWIVHLIIGLFAISLAVGQASAPGEDRIRLANGLYSRGLYELALAEYREILESYPAFEGRDTLLYRAGESARHLNRIDRAREFYHQVVTEGSQGVATQRARLRLADLAMSVGDVQGARENARALLELEPDDNFAASALHTLGRVAGRLDDHETAREMFERLIREYPEDVFAAYAAISLASMEPRDSEARAEWYRQALRNPPSRDLEVEALWGLAAVETDRERPEEAADLYQQLLRNHPDSARVQQGLLNIGWAFFQAGRFEEALEVVEEAPAVLRERHLDTWRYLEAVSYRMTGQEEEAYAAYRALLRETPDSRFRARAAFDLAVLHARRGEHAAVLNLTEDLMTLPDRRADVLWLLAESARAAGETTEALGRYQELSRVSENPERAADALFQRATLLEEQDPASAVEAYREFVREVPEDPRAPDALRAAGSLLIKGGDVKAAAALWDQTLRRYPEMEGFMELEFQTALLEIRAEERDRALHRLREHLEREAASPRKGEATFWMGMLLDQRGADGAEMAFRQALGDELSPDHQARARLRLGVLLQRQERPEEAIKVLRPLLVSAPERVPDSLLLWMYRQERSENQEEALPEIAEAMTGADREELVRELGYYAKARHSVERERPEEAIVAWTAGLAFGSDSEDAAEARLELGGTLKELNRLEEAEAHLAEGARLASRLERGDLHARALFGLGRLHAIREEWNEAARQFLSLAVLYDDEELTPQALNLAVEAFEAADKPREAMRARAELRQRYPDAQVTPNRPPIQQPANRGSRP